MTIPRLTSPTLSLALPSTNAGYPIPCLGNCFGLGVVEHFATMSAKVCLVYEYSYSKGRFVSARVALMSQSRA